MPQVGKLPLAILRGSIAAALACVALAAAAAAARPEPDALPGAGIYRDGVLPSGAPVQAARAGNEVIRGADAACVKCHRRSGLGAREGRITIPPVTGRYLYHGRSSAEEFDLPFVDGIRFDHEAYSDATLARAIREGVDAHGRSLIPLMPRYQLADGDMAALIDYLGKLDRPRVPGVGATTLHFATIVTPEADPAARKGMLDVLTQFVATKNSFHIGAVPRVHSQRTMHYMVNRQWQLHVWELTGAPDTWPAQLERKFDAEPVFAVLSGVGGRTWEPIHAFCEHRHVPCLFPNVEAPPATADEDFYSLYFTRGVTLEADLMAHRLLAESAGSAVREVRQLFRTGDVGEVGAAALASALRSRGIRITDSALARAAPESALVDALQRAAPAEAVILWLRPADLAALQPRAPPAGAVYLSGLMGGMERVPLAPTWRAHVHMAYPIGLPDERRINLDYAYGWFRLRHIPVVADRVQADTFLVCTVLAEALNHMADAFYPEYLIERLEDMLDKRLITGYYPRLALAPHQRFASKGGYVVKFPVGAKSRVAADGGWIVP